MENGPSPLNRRLRMTREARALTLEELGRKTGLNLGTISRLEREPRDPRASSLVRLAEALEVSVPFLLGTEDHDLDFPVALRRQALRRFLSIIAYDDQQRVHFEELCFFDSAPNSIRGWQDLTQNYNFLQTHKFLD
jgi:transcriptional regulator with XRE-family HTH domain